MKSQIFTMIWMANWSSVWRYWMISWVKPAKYTRKTRGSTIPWVYIAVSCCKEGYIRKIDSVCEWAGQSSHFRLWFCVVSYDTHHTMMRVGRELAYHDRLFDLLDERALTKGELRDFCVLLFGGDMNDIPDPVTDWMQFIAYVESRLQVEDPQWNPIKKKMKPWMSVKRLNKIYNGPGCSIM